MIRITRGLLLCLALLASRGALAQPDGMLSGNLSSVGSDTLASTGLVLVTGTLSVSEVGSDTLAGTGRVLVRGALAATESADVLAAVGNYVGQTDFALAPCRIAAVDAEQRAASVGAESRMASVPASSRVAALEPCI